MTNENPGARGVFITARVFTKGIEFRVPDARTKYNVSVGERWFVLNREAFDSYEKACRRAEDMRLRRIRSLKKQLYSLQTMSFAATSRETRKGAKNYGES